MLIDKFHVINKCVGVLNGYSKFWNIFLMHVNVW